VSPELVAAVELVLEQFEGCGSRGKHDDLGVVLGSSDTLSGDFKC
jgi:hypothetical protein